MGSRRARKQPRVWESIAVRAIHWLSHRWQSIRRPAPCSATPGTTSSESSSSWKRRKLLGLKPRSGRSDDWAHEKSPRSAFRHIDRETAGSLLGNLCSAASGYGLYKGASYLAGQLGQQVAPDWITVVDDGRMIGGLGSRPFDGKGCRPERTRSSTKACWQVTCSTPIREKLGLPSTGNASRSVGRVLLSDRQISISCPVRRRQKTLSGA